MNETQIIQGVALIADHQAPEIAQPGEETLNFPSPSVPAQRAAILRLRALPVAAMGSDHLDAQPCQRHVEWVGVVRAASDEPLRHLRYEAGIEGGGDKGNLMRRSRGGTDGERKTSAVCHCHELRTFAPL